MGAKNTKKFERRPPSAYPIFGQGCWRPKPCVYTALINTLLQRGVIGRPAVLNRFSGFHPPKPLKRLRFNGSACTQLKQGVTESCRPKGSKSWNAPGRPCSSRHSAAQDPVGPHQPLWTSNDKIWPGSASTKISTGRQQTSQSVVKRCEAMLVSMTSSKVWPQNGQLIEAEISTINGCGLPLRSSRSKGESELKCCRKSNAKESIWFPGVLNGGGACSAGIHWSPARSAATGTGSYFASSRGVANAHPAIILGNCPVSGHPFVP